MEPLINLTTATDLIHQVTDKIGLTHDWRKEKDTGIWLKRSGKDDTSIFVPKSQVGTRYNVDPNNVTITTDSQQ